MDDPARRAERRTLAWGDPHDRARVLVNRLRAGLVQPHHLAVAGWLGDEAARLVVRAWDPPVAVPNWSYPVRHALLHAGLERPLLVRLAADFAAHTALDIEARYPNDLRPRRAIEAACAWAACPCEEHRLAAYAADAAYADYAAYAAAYAADAYSAAARQAEREWQRLHMIAVLCGDPVQDPLGPRPARPRRSRRPRANPPDRDWIFTETPAALSYLEGVEPDHRHVSLTPKKEDADLPIMSGERVRWLIHTPYVVRVPVERVLLTEENEWNPAHAAALLEVIENEDGPVFRLPAARVHRIDRKDVKATEAERRDGQLEYQRSMLRPWEPTDVGHFYVKLLDGNHRALAAIAAGETWIPVVVGPDYRRDVKRGEWIEWPGEGKRPAWWWRQPRKNLNPRRPLVLVEEGAP